MKKTWIKIKRGLLEPKHREILGIRIWLYLYMLDKVNWETGIIYGWKDEDEAEDFSMPHRTLQKQRQQLEADGYINCKKKPYCLDITVYKWINPREYSGKVHNPISGTTQSRVPTGGGNGKETTQETTHQTTQQPITELGTHYLSSQVTDHINNNDKDNNNNEPFGLLMDAFINESNIPAFGINPRDVEAGQRMVQAGVTEADVIAAVHVLQDKGYNMVGLASVEKTAYNEAGKRKNKGDKDRSSDKARARYAEGWE